MCLTSWSWVGARWFTYSPYIETVIYGADWKVLDSPDRCPLNLELVTHLSFFVDRWTRQMFTGMIDRNPWSRTSYGAFRLFGNAVSSSTYDLWYANKSIVMKNTPSVSTTATTRGGSKHFHCYLLRSLDPSHPHKTYVGFTVRMCSLWQRHDLRCWIYLWLFVSFVLWWIHTDKSTSSFTTTQWRTQEWWRLAYTSMWSSLAICRSGRWVYG